MSSSRLLSLSGLLSRGAGGWGVLGASAISLKATPAGRALSSVLGFSAREASSVTKAEGSLSTEPKRAYRQIDDKELWHEAWMYEDKFGTEADPILVPSLEAERIIGVTDPEDDNLVVWGILRENEPPRQFIENGEFYLLQTVPYIKKVGDILDEVEQVSAATPLARS